MKTLSALHAFLRLRLAWLEQLLIAAGFTALLAQLVNARPVYPLHWDTVLLAGVFVLLLLRPTIGYFAIMAVALYPLGDISIYLAVLALAVALLGQRWFIPNLGLVLLVISAPFLNGAYLAWLVPVLGGLWWGPRAGLLAGLFAALASKILFGLLGLSPDWLALSGLYPDLTPALLRFHLLSSWQTLKLLATPFLTDTTTTLYHFLQISIWAFAGWLIGRLSLEDRIQYHRPRSTLALIIANTFVLGILQFLLLMWIGTTDPAQALLDNLLPNALLTLLVASLAESIVFFLEYPWRVPAADYTPAPPQRREERMTPPPALEPESGQPTNNKPKQDDESFILIELD